MNHCLVKYIVSHCCYCAHTFRLWVFFFGLKANPGFKPKTGATHLIQSLSYSYMRIELYCTLYFYQERVLVIFLHFFLLKTQYIRYKITFPYWNYSI